MKFICLKSVHIFVENHLYTLTSCETAYDLKTGRAMVRFKFLDNNTFYTAKEKEFKKMFRRFD